METAIRQIISVRSCRCPSPIWIPPPPPISCHSRPPFTNLFSSSALNLSNLTRLDRLVRFTQTLLPISPLAIRSTTLCTRAKPHHREASLLLQSALTATVIHNASLGVKRRNMN